MRKVPAALLASLFLTPLFAGTAVRTPAQSACAALNAAKGEGKFTGQISTPPDGSSMQVTYGDQSVLVHYNNSVTVCQGGQPASLNAVTRGASVSVFGPVRRNGQSMEIDAARIFVAGPLQTARPAPSAATTTPTLPRAQETQPRPTGQSLLPNSVILRGGTHEDTMKRLHVVRKYEISGLRNSPQVALGEARLDFRPMLNNPKALFNIAPRLRAMPQHVQVLEEASEISEVEQGLIMHHVLSYRVLPGKCADADAEAQLVGAGIACFRRASSSERLAEFSKPGAPRYVANEQKRQEAIFAFQRNSALADANANKGIADLRKALSNPAQRQDIVSKVGEAETARMATLSDDQLKEEIINASVQRFEETMFVPKVQSASYAHLQHTLTISASPAEAQAVQRLLSEGVPEHGAGLSNFPKLLKVVPARPLALSKAPGGDKAVDVELGPYFFLTGFTVSHDYEWHWGAEVTINWCIVGCSDTYGMDLHAGFNYAFGLRFPIETQFKYHILVHPNNSAEAKLTASFNPIEGNINDFSQAGLAGDQMFDAKELVAQVGADAGFDINLPGLSVHPDFPTGVDFTDLLRGTPFAGGSFLPPAPGAHGPEGQFFFDTIDLLGGLLNYGVAGGRLSPGVDVTLFSNKLQLTLNDETLRHPTILTSNPQTVSLGVGPSSVGSESRFSIGNPIYNLGFTLTPGLNPNVWVDISVWSNTWNWPIWFPQLALDLPAHGADFGCHADTTCVIDFAEVYNASSGQVSDLAKEADVADKTLTRDGRGTQGGGCELLGVRSPGEAGKYLCPIKGGMLGLCQAMLKTGSVASCGVFVPPQVDKALRYNGYCSGDNGAYACTKDMMGLCNLYLKNQEILSCTLRK
ncbi:MAG TPA: hypothetical protein VHM93_10665 [Candidatus Acidoferrum sp.]|jgi:hypothetical protein|nr:hypothetical protein [Candidatus Acidoferrum sp.]